MYSIYINSYIQKQKSCFSFWALSTNAMLSVSNSISTLTSLLNCAVSLSRTFSWHVSFCWEGFRVRKQSWNVLLFGGLHRMGPRYLPCPSCLTGILDYKCYNYKHIKSAFPWLQPHAFSIIWFFNVTHIYTTIEVLYWVQLCDLQQNWEERTKLSITDTK